MSSSANRTSTVLEIGAVRVDFIELQTTEVASDGELGSRGSVKVVGLDIGGTLTKLVFLEPTWKSNGSTAQDDFTSTRKLVCQIWPTNRIQACLSYLKSTLLKDPGTTLSVTGGGALKYASQLKDVAQPAHGQVTATATAPDFGSQDEMVCLAAGLGILQDITEELFSFDSSQMYPMVESAGMSVTEPLPIAPVAQIDPSRPVLLANAGTGVSFVLCPSQQQQPQAPGETRPAQRVGGTPLSGASLFGIMKLLTNNQDLTWENVLSLASRGDSRNVDLTVGDVYGSDYANVGLSGHRAAGFLGKITTSETRDFTSSASDQTIADVARSLVFAIGYNIGQQAALRAKLHGAARTICFTGSFGSGHPLVMGAIDYAVRVNSGEQHLATFLRHESFLGAVGAWALGMSAKRARMSEEA